MNETRLRVSGRHRMIESIFATGLPFGGRADLPETLKDLARLLPACAGVRRWGSAALDLAYVGAGRYDGFWERRLERLGPGRWHADRCARRAVWSRRSILQATR